MRRSKTSSAKNGRTDRAVAKPEHRWLCLLVTLGRSDADRAIELLWELGTLGVEESDFPSSPDPVTFKAFFPAERTPELLLNEAQQRFDAWSENAASLSVIQIVSNPDDWVEDYKKNFRGFSIGKTFYIHPSWECASTEHLVNIVIDPGHAFGTGTHESTQLCLLALENLSPSPRTILDVGTGSGILAIAARKLLPGAEITAIDNDPQAVEMSLENFVRNDVRDISLAVASPEAICGSFQLVLANLTEPIFRHLSSELARLSSHLIVSGFTEEQAHLVLEYFRAYGLRPANRRESGGWTCFEFQG